MLHKKSVLLHPFYCRPGTTKHLQDIEQAVGTHPSGCIQHAYPLSCLNEMVVFGSTYGVNSKYNIIKNLVAIAIGTTLSKSL